MPLLQIRCSHKWLHICRKPTLPTVVPSGEEISWFSHVKIRGVIVQGGFHRRQLSAEASCSRGKCPDTFLDFVKDFFYKEFLQFFDLQCYLILLLYSVNSKCKTSRFIKITRHNKEYWGVFDINLPLSPGSGIGARRNF